MTRKAKHGSSGQRKTVTFLDLPSLTTPATIDETADKVDNVDKREHQLILRQLRLQRRLSDSAADLMALWTPVSLSLVLACVMTLIRQSGAPDGDGVRVVLRPETDLVAKESAKGLQQWQLILITSLAALLIIVLMSFVMVALLKFNCFLCLRGYICLAFLTLAVHKLSFWFYTASNALGIPADWITVGVVAFNFLAMVALAMGAGGWAPKRLIQLVHILLSATVAYVISCIVLQGSFAYSATLCILFSAWDLFAVLCPRGPLNSLIKMAQSEQRVTSFMQPLVFTAAAWNFVAATDAEAEDDEDDNDDDADDKSEGGASHDERREPKRGSRLGLGDFIFYGVLAASATSQCGILGAVACYAGLSAGFCATLTALKLLDRALPALPLPVLAAVAAVVMLSATGLPFSDAMADRQIML